MGGGLHRTEVAFSVPTQQPQNCFLAFPKIYLNIVEIYWWRWSEENVQRLEDVDRTYLELTTIRITKYCMTLGQLNLGYWVTCQEPVVSRKIFRFGIKESHSFGRSLNRSNGHNLGTLELDQLFKDPETHLITSYGPRDRHRRPKFRQYL